MNEVHRSVVSAARTPPRTRSLRLVAAGSLTATTAAVAAVLLTAGGAVVGLGTPAFAVTRQPHGQVAIQIVSTAASAQQMTKQLQSKGLAVSITTVPSTPQLVGTWVATGASPAVPAKLAQSIARQALGHSVTLEIPAHFSGEVSMTVGRLPENGEQPVVGGARNALAPGGALACEKLSGATTQQAQTKLAELGYTIDAWTTAGPLSGNRLTTPPNGSRVVDAFVNDVAWPDTTKVLPNREKHVLIEVSDPGSKEYGHLLKEGFPPSRLRAGC